MPRLMDRMVPGVNAVYLSNAFVSNPICCPSRVSTLTGQYSDTSGVYSNDGSFTGGEGVGGGGFYSFDDDPAANPTIATENLQGVGYRTAMIGKYLNKYPTESNWRYVPPAGTAGSLYGPACTTTTWRRRTATGSGSETTRRLLDAGPDEPRDGLHPRNERDRHAVLPLPRAHRAARSASHIPKTSDGSTRTSMATISQHPSASREEREHLRQAGLHQEPRMDRKLQAGYDTFHARQLSAIMASTAPSVDLGHPTRQHRRSLYERQRLRLGRASLGEIVPYNESIRVPMILATKGLDMPSIDPGRGPFARRRHPCDPGIVRGPVAHHEGARVDRSLMEPQGLRPGALGLRRSRRSDVLRRPNSCGGCT